MIASKSIMQGITQKRIVHHGCSHTVTETCIIKKVRCLAHILHTACHNDISISAGDQLGCQIHTVQTGTAEYVNRSCRNLYRDSCVNCCLSCGVLSKSCLDNTAHIYLINLLRPYTGSLQSLFDHNGSQIRCGCCT